MNPYTNYQYQPNPYAGTHNGITWVQGVEGAKAYQLQPNSNAMLLDSENEGIFYIKISDNVGMCTLRTFKYQEVSTTPSSDYVRKEDLKAEVEALVNAMLGGKNE